MSELFDAIVIGAGHNGLTRACYLVNAGLKILALDQYHTVGGMATTKEITRSGFRSDLHAFGYQFVNRSPVPQELTLSAFGFELIPPEIYFSQAFPDGGIISMHRSLEDAVGRIGRYSRKDGETWLRGAEWFVSQKKQIAARMNSPPASLAADTARLSQRPMAWKNTASRCRACDPGQTGNSRRRRRGCSWAPSSAMPASARMTPPRRVHGARPQVRPMLFSPT